MVGTSVSVTALIHNLGVGLAGSFRHGRHTLFGGIWVLSIVRNARKKCPASYCRQNFLTED